MGLLSGSGAAAYKSIERTNFTATAGQTSFTLSQGYSVGDVDVFLNGVKLVEGDDYYATNGISVVLNSGANLNDVIQIVSYNQFDVANAYTKPEADSRYMVATGATPMSAYLKAPNYGISSWSDSATVSMEASTGAGEQGVGIKAFGRSVSANGGDLLYTSDNRGSSGKHRFGTWNGVTFTNLMSLDSSGRVSMPLQPAFQASTSASQVGNGAVLPFNNARLNIGSCFNTSTYRFTAPINGSYWFHYHNNHSGSAGALYADFYKNGTFIGYGRMYSQHTGSGWEELSGTIIAYLNAGDYITVNLISSHTADSGLYSSFCGALLG